MLIRVRVLGSGTNDDPFHVPLPNHVIVSIDYAALTAIVDVPRRDHPPVIPAQNAPQWLQTPGGPALTGLTAAQLAAWSARLSGQYGRPPDTFNPEVV